jgi:hypothetical protein
LVWRLFRMISPVFCASDWILASDGLIRSFPLGYFLICQPSLSSTFARKILISIIFLATVKLQSKRANGD